jgi:hypothetical protein
VLAFDAAPVLAALLTGHDAAQSFAFLRDSVNGGSFVEASVDASAEYGGNEGSDTTDKARLTG